MSHVNSAHERVSPSDVWRGAVRFGSGPLTCDSGCLLRLYVTGFVFPVRERRIPRKVIRGVGGECTGIFSNRVEVHLVEKARGGCSCARLGSARASNFRQTVCVGFLEPIASNMVDIRHECALTPGEYSFSHSNRNVRVALNWEGVFWLDSCTCLFASGWMCGDVFDKILRAGVRMEVFEWGGSLGLLCGSLRVLRTC